MAKNPSQPEIPLTQDEIAKIQRFAHMREEVPLGVMSHEHLQFYAEVHADDRKWSVYQATRMRLVGEHYG